MIGLVRTKVSEERRAFIIRVTRNGELGPILVSLMMEDLRGNGGQSGVAGTC
jgi:hypothetical protein